jgi:hypothetical protein
VGAADDAEPPPTEDTEAPPEVGEATEEQTPPVAQPVRAEADPEGETQDAPDAEPSPDSPPAPIDTTRVRPDPEEDRGEEQVEVFARALERAKNTYFAGDHVAALQAFRALHIRLLQGEEPPWDLASETVIYLGEIENKLGNDREADGAFRWLLEQDPDTPISPYHHPMDVVGRFELMRQTVLAERARTPDEVGVAVVRANPLPVWGYLPLGIPQFTSKRPAAGVLFGGLQTAFGVASVALFRHLDSVNVSARGHPSEWTDEEIETRVRVRRYAVQWPCTVAFYGTWLLSYADARKAHRASQAPAPPQPVAMSVSGRF